MSLSSDSLADWDSRIQIEPIPTAPVPSPLPTRLSTPKLQKIASVETNNVPSTPTAPLSAAGEDSEDATGTGTPATPRQSGSMVTHHDDVVTRMKNIEMIELGIHRIKPWYFAPYPQVCWALASRTSERLTTLDFSSRRCAANLAFTYVNSVSSTERAESVWSGIWPNATCAIHPATKSTESQRYRSSKSTGGRTNATHKIFACWRSSS